MRNPFIAGLTAAAVGASVALVAIAEPAAAATPRPVIYVAAASSLTTGVLDGATYRDVNTLTAGGGEGEIAHNPAEGLTFVASGNYGISVIEAATSRLLYSAMVGADPRGVAVAPNGRAAYVADFGSNDVYLLDGRGYPAGRHPVGAGPQDVVVSPDNLRLYVTTAAGVQVVDANRFTVTATIPAGTRPYGIALTPDGKRAYVTDYGTDNVSVIDTTTNTVTSTITVGAKPYDVALTPDGKRAYVVNSAANTVSVIDTTSGSVIATVPAGPDPHRVAMAPDGRHAYVTTTGGGGRLIAIDTAGNTAAAPVALGFPAIGVAVGLVDPAGPQVVLDVSTSEGDNLVYAHTWGTKSGLARLSTYTIDFGDGTVVGGAYDNPNLGAGHTYAAPGAYTVTLTLTDVDGRVGSTSRPVRITTFVRSTALLSLSNLRYVTAEDQGRRPAIANRTAVGAWEGLELFDYGGGAVALRSKANGLFLWVDPDTKQLIAYRTEPMPFDLLKAPNGVLSLRDPATGMYVSSNNGAGPLTADRPAIGPWEKFSAVLGTANAALLGVKGYVTAEAGGTQPLRSDRSQIGQWETFDLIDAGDGQVAFLAHANYRFVTAENGGAAPLIANRTAVGDWEKFRIVDNPLGLGSKALVAAANGRYVTAENSGWLPLIANRTQAGDWERFWFEYH
ncbi:beta-propeller fold lactonase family protein [Dactylosporangium sp. McL0621]|uniref:beta-propeller fold lactonase family protein n=1 Tax=Dactylosporangium sp. McL0621 TaxID=3415678 RepID=UPI003CEFAB12